MKILHVYKDYYPVLGGIENHIKILAESQANMGFDVTVLTTAPSRETTIENINSVKVIKAARVQTISRTPISLSLIKWMHNLKMDIAHLHFPYPMGEFANYFFGQAVHTVITYHSDIIKQRFILQLYKPLLIKVLEKADRIIATSPQYRETSPFLKRISYKCTVIPLGIDISRFSKPEKLMSREIRGKYKTPKMLLFVGRLRYFKGLKYLIEAMKSVDAKLLIIGTGPDEHFLKTAASKEGLNEKIVFLGDIADTDLPAYYDACDIFILPSSHRSEAFGTVLIEAMASGKAVISTELGTGTSFVNIHGETGFVVPPRNSTSLAEAITRLLTDDSLRKEFAVNSKKRAEEFSKERLNKRIAELYTEVLNGQNSGDHL